MPRPTPTQIGRVHYIKSAPTVTRGRFYSLAAGEEKKFSGLLANAGHRLWFIVKNRNMLNGAPATDVNLTIRVSQPAQAEGETIAGASTVGPVAYTLPPTEGLNLQSSDEVWVKNNNAAGTIECNICEVFYRDP